MQAPKGLKGLGTGGGEKTWLDAHEKKLEEIPEDDKPFTTMLKEITEKREKSKPLEKGPEAAAPPLEKGSETTPAPLEKGSASSEPLEKGPLVETKTEPWEKGTEASASNAAPLEKGSETTPAPLEKGSASSEPLEEGPLVESKTEPLEKGTEASASNAAPLEKGSETTPAPLEKGSETIPAPLEKGSETTPAPLKKGKVMIDFYNVLFLGSTIPPGSLTAILLLLENGFQPIICSFCGKERARLRCVPPCRTMSSSGAWKSSSPTRELEAEARVLSVSLRRCWPCSTTVRTFCRTPLKKGSQSTQSKQNSNGIGGGVSLVEKLLTA